MAVITPKLTDLVVAMQNNYTCSICLELLTHPIVTKCNHQFCRECSQSLLKQPPPVSCPLCKTRLTKRSFSENPFGAEVARAVQQVMAAIKKDAPHAKISPPKGPCGPNEFDDPASQRSEVIFIPETAREKPKSRKRVRNKEPDIIQENKRPHLLQNPITVYTDKNEEPSVTVKTAPITNTNIRSGFPSTRSKKIEMVYDKPCLRSSKPVEVLGTKNKPAITGCQIVAETCPIPEEEVVEVEKEVVTEKEITVKVDRDNVEDMEDDVLVSISQVSPQEFQPSRTVTSRMLSMVTGQTQSPRAKVASWLQKAVDEPISAVQTPKINDVKLSKKLEVEGKSLPDPYEFVSSQRGTPHYTAKTTKKRKQQPKRNYAGRGRKPFYRTDTAFQSLSTKYVNNARTSRNKNQSSSSQFYSGIRRKSSPQLKQKPQLDLNKVGDNLDSPTQDTFDALVVEHNKTVSEHVDMPKIKEEEGEKEDYDDYALFVTPRCPPAKDLNALCLPRNQKSKTPAKKKTLTTGRARKISELQDIVAELEEASRFTLNVSGKRNEPKANVTPAVKKPEEKDGNEIAPKVEHDRKLRERNTKPTFLSKGPVERKKKGSSDERRGGFEFFTAEDEVVDITVSQSDDEIPPKEKALARKESVSPKKKGSTSSEVEWRRISQLNRDFYSKRRKSCGDENAQNTHNANGDKRNIKSQEEAASKSGLAQNPSQRSTKSCNLIGLDKDDNLIEVLNPDNNSPDIDLQNIAPTSADNVVITDAKRHTSSESIEVLRKTPPGKARSLDADKHDLAVITDKRLEAKDEAQNTESAKPFKCPFTVRGKLEVTPADVSQYLCSKCKIQVVPEDKVEVEPPPPQDKLKASDSETDEDEDVAVLLTRSSLSCQSPEHDENQIVLLPDMPTSPLPAGLPSETQDKLMKFNVTSQVEEPNNSQTQMPRNTPTPTQLSQTKVTNCSQDGSQNSGRTKCSDKLEVKTNSQKSTAIQDGYHFDTWNSSWFADKEESHAKPQDSFEDHNDKENQQDVEIFKDEGHVPKTLTPEQNNTKSQHCVPEAIAATQRSTPPRAALAAQSPKSNHVAEKEKCQRVPERKFCRIKPPVHSDTDSSDEQDEAQKSCHLETKRLEDKQWSDYLKMKYCNKSNSQSGKVTHDPPSAVIVAKKPVESAATPPTVIDLETEDDYSQSGESLFGSQTDNVPTRSQNMRNTITNIRKDLEMAGLSYPSQQALQNSQGVSQKKQLHQSSESNPRGEDKKDKDEEAEDWALSAGVNVTTDRNPAARQGASASSRGAGDDGSSIFLFERGDDDLQEELSGIALTQTVPYNTQTRMQLEDQVESLQQKIQRLEAQLKAQK